MFSIHDLTGAEARMIHIAEYEYGDYFKVANSIVMFLWKFSGKIDPDFWIFTAFLSQVQKSALLALMSAVRQHDIQTSMMMRYTLESATLAVYSTHEKNEDCYHEIKEDGTVSPNDALRKAYKWMEKAYPEYNEIVKFQKATLNKHSTHGNILPSVFNVDFHEEGKVRFNFFDTTTKDLTNFKIWCIADICFKFLNVIGYINKEQPFFESVPKFNTIMSEYNSQINFLKENLRHTETFKGL